MLDVLNLDEAHFALIRNLFTSGEIYTIRKGSYVGHKRLEVDFVNVWIRHPEMRPLSPQLPQGIPPVATDEDIEKYFVEYLMDPTLQPNELYKYSTYIYPQVQPIIEILKRGGDGTNQAAISIGDVESPFQDDPPCLRCLHFKIKNGKLRMFVYHRSWDCFSGFPLNVGGYQLLKEYIALEVGVEPGETVAFSSGLHLYDFQWPVALSRLNGVLPENSVITEEEVNRGEKWMKK